MNAPKPYPSRFMHHLLLAASLALMAGFISCHSGSGGGGSSSLTILAPTITTQPMTGTVALGSPATFTGAASGTPQPSYAWSRSNDGGKTWTAIPGATGASYTLAAASVDDNNAQFQLAASNVAGTADSNPATLTVSATAGQTTQVGLPAGSAPTGMTLGPDGNIWFTNQSAGQIGVLDAITHVPTLMPLPSATSMPTGITSGPDGRMWFTEEATGKIGAITLTGGTVSEYDSQGTVPVGITTGPDGALWYTLKGSNAIGRMTPAGGASLFPLLTVAAGPADITLGTDGNLWFTEKSAGQVGRITPAGTVTEWVIPTPTGGVMPSPQGIAVSADGSIWIADAANNQLVKVTPPVPAIRGGRRALTTDIIFVSVQLPGGSAPLELAVDTSGNIWAVGQGSVSSVTPSGTVTNLDLPTTLAGLVADITEASDGTVYLSVPGGDIIVQFLTTPPTSTESFAIKPGISQVLPGGTVQFSAEATGVPDTGVSWSIQEGAAGGTISPLGLYQAPAAGGIYHIVGTSTADSTLTSTAAVNVETAPIITSFIANPTTPIASGQNATLMGIFTGGTGVISPGNIPATSGTAITVTPAGTTTYTLTVTNPVNGLTATAQAAVTVTGSAGNPIISSFTANPTSVTPPAGSLLSWNVTGATSLSIDQGVGTVTGTSTTVFPTVTTTYTLTASNGAGGTVSATVTVAVLASKPTINSFTANPTSVTPPAGSLLSWSVTGATSLSIDQGVGTVTGTSLIVYPTVTTTYTLTASNGSGSTLSTPVTVTVEVSKPTINSFTASPTSVAPPAGSTLSWSVTGATSLSIDQGVGTVTGTSTTVYPTVTTTYTLTASNGGGSTLSAPVTVTVSAAGNGPATDLFLPPSVHPGDTWMQASLPVQTGLSYLWTILPGTAAGTITSGQGTGSIAFSAGTAAGTFQVQANTQVQGGGSSTDYLQTVIVRTGTWLVESPSMLNQTYEATATLLANGRLLVAGGAGVPSVASKGQALPIANAEIYDPVTNAWIAANPMIFPRATHTANRLNDGTVLVAGGANGGGLLAYAEIYSPATGAWTLTGSMATAREYHTASLLPDGKVLVVGGSGTSGALSSTEIFDPAAGTWTASGSLITARYNHTATTLADGSILVAGGRGASGPLASAEIYNPATGTWAATGSMGAPRSDHSATFITTIGKVLVAGNYEYSGDQASVELYDPASGTWSATGSLNSPRGLNTTTLLQDGTVLVAGGNATATVGNAGGPMTSCELYTPATGLWTVVGSLGTGRYYHTATLLNGGNVIVTGGLGGIVLASSERYVPANGAWNPTGLGTATTLHTATLLGDGSVLMAGGFDYNENPFASAAIFGPASRVWTPTGSLITARGQHTATFLPGTGAGTVIVTGGRKSPNLTLASTERYDPATGLWTATGSLTTARASHTATRLADGRILVAGGIGNTAYLASAEIYDPGTGVWTPTGSMAAARFGHTATLIGTKVLVAGGEGNGNQELASAEIFDPATGLWTSAGSMAAARAGHTASLLAASGKVLVAGGVGSSNLPLSSAELYDPSTGQWSSTGSMSTIHAFHTATPLGNGTILAAGGLGTGGPSAVTETYDPVAGVWTPTGSFVAPRTNHTATLLQDGSVMVAFGEDADVITEIYQ